MHVVKNADVPWKDLGGGLKRRVLAYTRDGMAVEVAFEAGGIGEPHSHTHAQCTYVKTGAFAFTIGGMEYEVAAGDTLAFEKGETHGCVCRAAGTLIDFFSPMREDFI